MKIKMMGLSCLIVAIVLFAGYQYSMAKSKTDAESIAKKEVKNPDAASSKIGVVSVRKVFENCKRNAKYREEAKAEQDKIIADLEKMKADIDAGKAGLKTRKEGSNDYMALVKEVLEKQAGYQAQQEFQKQQIELKDQRWTEQLYKDILKIVQQIAQNKGMDMVFEADEPQFPSASVNELMLFIRTHKLLYSAGCMDITDEVLAMLDANDSQPVKTDDTQKSNSKK
jgi:Skp family chaperone for outer membrane proteins